MTKEALHILQHSLGCDEFGASRHTYRDEGDGCFNYYRNRYVSDPTPELQALVAAELMKDHGPVAIYGGMHFYSVTKAGVAAMKANSPKLSRSKQRYREFLDADCGLKFGEWLKLRVKAVAR